MEGYGVGMMARSLAGHDKGKVYMVLDVKEPFVYLVDGKIRTLDHPKKKGSNMFRWIGIFRNGSRM